MHLSRAGVCVNSGSYSKYPLHCGHRAIVPPTFAHFTRQNDKRSHIIACVNKDQQRTRLLKAEEIAVMLGLKVQTVYTMARRGELEKVKLSRKCLRFRADDVERFIEKKTGL
jgi:excisionase family DNA binding protein